ncbi:protein YELLOW LEAF 1, choloroplastic-like [Malus sylvestris]|uniref:protein YELLOW LEAF 1, choloroplastic-like n=1 Tax=Malus sylvestris TaxID=3752 RepID=UPI0021ACCC98|nr:protein YELLOW LEAF 1, choloroplastic-like [Malus sylvestris]XP_050139157.1 protein YELLOW LEAF 1, choloroplastic-like [Malus sylvestris]
MPMLTSASAIVNSPPLPAGQCRGQFKLSSCGPKKVHVDGKMVHLKIGAVGLGAQFPLERRNPVTVSNRRQSASVICASALNARCGAEQTQTVTREAPTITHLPGKEKSPLLDDGGSGFPPRDDGDGGGGGGGGGGNFSGGFAFFGFLLFLSFLKDKESEGSYRENRRR